MNKRSGDAYERALAAFHAGQLGAAASALRELLADDSGNPQARQLAGVVALTRGLLEEAETHFQAAVSMSPAGAPAAPSWTGLGRVRLAAGRLHEALACFRRAGEADPDFAPAYSGQAAAHCDLGDYRRAESCARRSLMLAEDPRTRLVLARALLFQGRIEEAEALLHELAQIPEVRFLARFHQAACAAARGQRQEAEESLRALLREQPAYPGYLELAKAKRFHTDNDPDIEYMRQRLDGIPELPPRVSTILRADLSFALAKAYEDLGAANTAFSYLRAANELRAQEEPYDHDEFAQRAHVILQAARSLVANASAGKAKVVAAPLLIAALPRSGSTLLEQMLCGHPQIAAGGEFSPFIPLLDELVDGHEKARASVQAATGDNVDRAREHIAEALGRQQPGTLYLTDKSPVAFLYAGMLYGVQKSTRVIHLRRHPLDTALSQYMHAFARGLGWTYSLEAIARYRSVYEQVMEAWAEILGPNLIEVEYEALVHDARGQLERILHFCGLSWDPACLDYQQRARAVVTASGLQVREPLSRRSIGKWRSYREQITVLRKQLADVTSRHEERLRRRGIPY